MALIFNRDGENVEPLGYLNGQVTSVSFDPKNDLLLTGATAGRVGLWGNWKTNSRADLRFILYANPVRAVQLRDEKTIVFVTDRWLHVSSYDQATNALTPVASRPLPGNWIGKDIWFADPLKTRVSAIVAPTEHTLQRTTVRLDKPTASPIQGVPIELLETWSRRLGIRINEAGEMVR